MADKPLFSLKFPGLPDRYTIDGLSDDAKQALLQIASKVAYIDDQGAAYYQALYDALYNTTWSITNTLSHCVTSNAADSVTKGDSYTATITAATGYKMAGATVSITMGGTDITASAYSNGVISIAAVTGNLVISVSAADVEVESISAVYTQSGTVYDTDSLDSLKTDLVVTATYDDTSTATVPSADYTLSGTLTEGTSTITVSYGGKTTTFTVSVTYKEIQFVEWIEAESGAGSSYFRTGVNPTNTFGFKIEIARAAWPNPFGTVDGCKGSSDATACFVNALSSAKFAVAFAAQAVTIDKTYDIYEKATILVNYLNSRKAEADGTVGISTLGTLTSPGQDFVLMGRNINGTVSSGFQRFYGAEFTDGSNITHRFKPCYKRRTNEIGLYEEINEQFYANGGTGTLTKGADV